MRMRSLVGLLMVVGLAGGVMGQTVPPGTTLPAGTAKVGEYTVTGVAHAGSGGVVLVKVVLLKVQGDTTTEVVSRPYVQMKDGQTAEIVIGTGDGPAAATMPANGGDVRITAPEKGEVRMETGGGTLTSNSIDFRQDKPEAFSGMRLQLVKATSSKEVNYMAMVVEKDVVVWAGTGTFKVEAAAPPPTTR